jgi:hypothetical protein
MTMNDNTKNKTEPTAVDDVRKVRQRIAAEHAGDIRQHVKESRRLAEKLPQELALKPVSPPPNRRDGAGG